MVAKLYIGTPSHHIALSFKISPKFLFRPSPRRATTGTRTELGSLLTWNVVQKKIKNQRKEHRAKEICSVEQRLAGRGSRWLQTFLQTEKIRTAQILGDLIEYIPSESWTFKTFKIRRFGTELHGTSQSFGGKFLPSLSDSPGRSAAFAPSSPISLPSSCHSVAVCFMASATTCSSETGARQRPPICRGCAVCVEIKMGITNS